ncbi:MAG: putative glycoside hydrolase [Bacillota bacterium]
MKTTLFTLFLTLVTASLQAQLKTCTYWTTPIMSEQSATQLSKDDLLIIDYENLWNNRESIEKIRKLNPKVKILIYSNPMEVWDKTRDNRTIANELLAKLPKEYRLKRSDGKPAVFWKGMQMMNLTTKCPKVDGKDYIDYYSSWIAAKVLQDPLIDGYFVDNGTPTISWVDSKIDADNNKVPDPKAALDAWWKEGMTRFLKEVRKGMKPGSILVTNKGERHFFPLNDGVMFERFPNDYIGGKLDGGWHQSMKNAADAGKYTIFQVDLKDAEFGMASSLLLDNVYVAVTQNMSMPNNQRYDVGKPLGKAYKKGKEYIRDYQNATVIVIPSTRTGKIVLKDKPS